MINLSDFLEEIEGNFVKKSKLTGAKFKNFKPFQCENCGQEFDLDALTVSILLYGVFFTVGSEEGYAGFNCPKCLKTQLLKADIETLRLFYTSIGSFQINLKYADGYKEFRIDFRHHYQSIGQYNLRKLKELKALDFSVSTHCVNYDDWKGLFYDERAAIMNETMCSSFYFDSHPISGPTVSVLYAKIEDIPKFVKLENAEGRRLIPRYIYGQPIYSLADNFCWDFDFESKHFEEQKAESEKFSPNEGERKEIEEEDAKALQREIDLGYIPADFKSSYHVINNSQEIQRLKDTAPSHFFSIITQSVQMENIVDLSAQDHVACKKIWGKIHPFKDTGVAKYFFNNEEFIDDRKVPEYTIPEDETIKEVLELHSKNYGAKFLTENYPHFINDYYKLLNTECCSFRAVDDLRMRYLDLALNAMREDAMLEETARKEALNARQYAFFKEGKAWTIRYKGKAIRGLQGNGFRYIYYLVQNPFKQVKTVDLKDLDNANPAGVQGWKNTVEEFQPMAGKADDRPDTKPENKHRKRLRDRLTHMKEERAKAKREDDRETIEELNKELEFIEREFSELNNNRRVSRKSKGGESIKKRDAVTHAINYAIEGIRGEKQDQTAFSHEVADHFKKALRPIYSFDQCYRPKIEVDWFFN